MTLSKMKSCNCYKNERNEKQAITILTKTAQTRGKKIERREGKKEGRKEERKNERK